MDQATAEGMYVSEDGGRVGVELSTDEALVLFDWLARTSDNGAPVAFTDAAEQRVLWNLECLLERVLVEPLSADYIALVQEARRAVVGDEMA